MRINMNVCIKALTAILKIWSHISGWVSEIVFMMLLR